MIERVYDRLTNPDYDSDAASPNAVQGTLAQLARIAAEAAALLDDRAVLRMPPLGEMR